MMPKILSNQNIFKILIINNLYNCTEFFGTILNITGTATRINNSLSDFFDDLNTYINNKL